jgi:hypothetical protein
MDGGDLYAVNGEGELVMEGVRVVSRESANSMYMEYLRYRGKALEIRSKYLWVSRVGDVG